MKKTLVMLCALVCFALMGCANTTKPETATAPNISVEQSTAGLELTYDVILAKYQSGTITADFLVQISTTLGAYLDEDNQLFDKYENDEEFLNAYLKLTMLVALIQNEMVMAKN